MPEAANAAAGPPAAGAGRAAARPGSAHREAEGRYVVRRGNRAVIDIDGGVRWERLTPETLRHLDFFELVYGPGAESNPTLYSHPGTEMVLIMAGVLEISVGFETYRLEPGDSMQFPSSMPHRYANPALETARAVTVILYDCPADAAGIRRTRRQRPPSSPLVSGIHFARIDGTMQPRRFRIERTLGAQRLPRARRLLSCGPRKYRDLPPCWQALAQQPDPHSLPLLAHPANIRSRSSSSSSLGTGIVWHAGDGDGSPAG